MSLLTDKIIKRKGDRKIKAVECVNEERKLDNNTGKESEAKMVITKNSDFSFTEYFNMNTMSRQIATDQWAEKTAKNMIEWAQTDDALILNDFFSLLGICRQDFLALANKYPILKTARDYAKSLIASRRERGMLTRKFDSGSVSFMMPMYSEDWKENVEWRSSLKAAEGKAGNDRVQYVVIPAIPTINSAEEGRKEDERKPELSQAGQVDKQD
jgi:hypothetical protein